MENVTHLLHMASWSRTDDPTIFEIVELIIGGIIPIILILVGTLGNLICAIILLNKENRRTSTNVYLIFLCITDTISLYQWNLSYTVYTFTGGDQEITNQSLFLCKWGAFLSFYTLHTSAMFLTLVALDRACLLWNVWYKRKLARPLVALAFCSAVSLILFAFDGFLFGLGIEVYDNSTGTETTAVTCYHSLNTKLNDFFNIEYQWIHLVIMYVIPFILMLLCTVLTVKKLTVRRITDNQQLVQNAQRNRRISLMLLFMCATYVLLTLPNRICFLFFVNGIMKHEYTDAVLLTANTLMYTRNATNIFFLYFLVNGFRRDVHKLWTRRRTTQVVPIPITRPEQTIRISVIPTRLRNTIIGN